MSFHVTYHVMHAFDWFVMMNLMIFFLGKVIKPGKEMGNEAFSVVGDDHNSKAY